MRTYFIVFYKVLGGDWYDFKLGQEQFQTNDLASAICMADTIKGPIHEAMVIRVQETRREYPNRIEIFRTYDLVE